MERRQFIKEVANKICKNMYDLFIGSGISAPSGFLTWKDFPSSSNYIKRTIHVSPESTNLRYNGQNCYFGKNTFENGDFDIAFTKKIQYHQRK